jgi:transposase InsO family protein
MEDGRCKLGLRGRLQLVLLVENGSTLRAAAAALGVAPGTAHRWWHRWKDASPTDRASRACLRTRSSRPRSCPWALSSEDEQAILTARAKTNYGPMQLQFLCGRHRSRVWKVLRRHGVSRQRRTERPQTTRRYEWTEAGALLHIDAFELAKFDRPGHWAHGDRSEPHKTRGAGKVKVIGVIDDHTRLAYCEIHSAENAITVSATLRRAAGWFGALGCGPVQAVMSDNATCYATSFEFRDTLSRLGARHVLIPPRTPRWNGKIERFFGTLDREWAHGRVWPNSTQRDRAPSSFIRYYNRRRPHTACGGRPPITRVHHLRGQNT